MKTKEAKKKDGMQKIGLSFAPGMTKDLGHGVIEVIVSTDREDYHGEKINPDGINIKEYHGTVLYGHDYEGLPIAKTTKLWKDKAIKGLKARLQFAVEELPFAKTVYDLIKGGYLTDVSIGGLVTKWSDDWLTIEEMIMKEFSIVPIGANADAQVVAMSIGKSMNEVKGEYEDAMIKHFAEKVKSVPKGQIKEVIKSIKVVLAALEGEVDGISEENADGPVNRVKFITLKNHAKKLDKSSEQMIKIIKVSLKAKKEN